MQKPHFLLFGGDFTSVPISPGVLASAGARHPARRGGGGGGGSPGLGSAGFGLVESPVGSPAGGDRRGKAACAQTQALGPQNQATEARFWHPASLPVAPLPSRNLFPLVAVASVRWAPLNSFVVGGSHGIEWKFPLLQGPTEKMSAVTSTPPPLSPWLGAVSLWEGLPRLIISKRVPPCAPCSSQKTPRGLPEIRL